MRKTKAEAEVTRKNLIKASLAVFSRMGYAETRLEDIANEAGVTRGAIYHHFGSKVELYHLLIKQANARMQPTIERALKEGAGPLDTLRRFLIDVLVFVSQDEEFRAIQEIVLFKAALTPELSEGIKRRAQGTRQLVEKLEEIIRAGQESGEIRMDMEPRTGALALLSFQNGILTQWLFDPGLFSLEVLAKELSAIFLQGIAT